MLKIDLSPDAKSLRVFGFIAVGGFSLMALVFHWKFDAPGWLIWGLVGLGVCQGLAAWARLHSLIRPVYAVMAVLGMAIGMVVGPIILGVIFFVMFTPLALWFRMVGRGTIDRKPDPEASSYWTVRKAPVSPARYLRLY